MQDMPEDFVVLKDTIPGLMLDVRYCTNKNFTGQVVPGYESDKLVLSLPAAMALLAMQETLRFSNLAIKVFDAYRPQRAVSFFVDWAHAADDPVLKATYYPNIDKDELFRQGYLLRNSSHSRGSTVDLTLVDRQTGTELDMGTPFDFFDQLSWPDSTGVSLQQRANRLLLRQMMREHGFVPLAEEWWHFTLRKEPYPDTYFDFVVG